MSNLEENLYRITSLEGFLVYGFFELAGTPFDYWHLSNMFTISLFFIPAALEHSHHHSHSQTPKIIPVAE